MSRTGSSFRAIIVLPAAALVTLGIFFAMSGLIRSEAILDTSERPAVPDIFMSERTPPPLNAGDLTTDNIVPPPPVEPGIERSAVDGPDFTPGPAPAPTGPDQVFTQMPSLNSAILQFQPTYPASCQNRGTEGYAIVVFDVTANGDVVNARVADSSHACFERAALDAIRKWKFSPTPRQSGIVSRGLRKSFVFRLSQ
ncbi:energy transducer TonB [Parvularcula sp. IMCC14364]|uniref:energy transducer TonB n=1 Tax=Parvularcula sp. IMCC14364 TaxID=3067902 RepID=UPI0027423089|nr:energy transducer TonB [Parvularcula sp. IMCC14364]